MSNVELALGIASLVVPLVIGGIVGGVRAYNRLDGRIAEVQRLMTERIVVLETKIGLFWQAVSADAARVLHSPDPAHRHMDLLLERYLDGLLTTEEVQELKQKLVERRDDRAALPGQRAVASTMLRALEGLEGLKTKEETHDR